jgi:hypothetical protein
MCKIPPQFTRKTKGYKTLLQYKQLILEYNARNLQK